MDNKRYEELLKDSSKVKKLAKHGEGYYTFAEIEELSCEDLEEIEILHENEVWLSMESKISRLEKHGDGCYENWELQKLSVADWEEIELRDYEQLDAFFDYRQAWGY